MPPATPTRPLPRSLDPLPEESLPGYLLRLAHRLGLSPLRVTVLTGLTGGHGTHVAASRMVEMEPGTVHTFAAATRLAAHEAAALTLAGPGGCDPGAAQAALRGLARTKTWVFTSGTRYCPPCLAGDGSEIQARHGGPWNKFWRLAPVFACTTHRRLLEPTCPACGHLALAHDTAGPGQILPRLPDPTLHPAQCRSTLADRSACGHRLDAVPPTHATLSSRDHDILLALAERLGALWHPGGPATVTSAGQPTSPARYLADLRAVAALAQASWPQPRTATDLRGLAAAFDDYLAGPRREADLRHLRRGTPRRATAHDMPPVDPAACGSLLALAAEILDSADIPTAHERLAPLVAHARRLRPWARGILADTGPCSPALRTAADLHNFHVGVSSRPHHPPGTRRRLPRRQRRFGHQHIPAYLLPEWHAQYFSGLDGVNPRHLRRTAAVKLTQMCEGGGVTEAAELLDIPPARAASAIKVTRRSLDTRGWELLHQALGALADHLDDTATHLIDYQRRRHATRTWAVTPAAWAELVGDLARDYSSADWSDRKRLFATVAVWTRVTRGEHLFAPALTPGRQSSRPAENLHYIHEMWHNAHSGTGSSHYAPLVERLDALAAELATKIDNAQDSSE